MTTYTQKAKLEMLDPDPSQSESVYNFWRSSKNPRYLGDRLCNRSWRLINDKLLTNSSKCYKKSVLTVHDRPLELHHRLVNRPSLFLNNSKSTAESDLSLRSPGKRLDALESGDDTSDLSEDYSDSDDDIQDEEKVSLRTDMSTLAKSATLPAKNNIFYILNSPASPVLPYRNHSASSLTYDKATEQQCKKAGSSGTSHLSEQNLLRQDSLFGGMDMRSLSLKESSSASSSDISEDDEYDSEDELDPEDIGTTEKRETEYKRGEVAQSESDGKSVKIEKIPRSSEDNDSEWLSASSEGEPLAESPKQAPLSFTKKYPVSNSSASTLSESPVCSEPSPASSKPRSLLSGLFLNEMNGPSSQSASSGTSSETPKPLLKRSSTTGVITVEEVRKNDKSALKSILYSKRYASLSDMARRLPSQRSPVTFPISSQQKFQERIPNSKRQDPLFAKQTSLVGVSNLMVLAEGTGSPESRSIKHNPKIKLAENISLSSSLSKYSGSLNQHSGNSLKSLLSNSAINISSILSLGITNKLRKQSRSSETLKGSEEDLSTLFAGYLSRQHSQEGIKEIPLSRSVRVTPTREFEPSVEISKSLKDSLMIDYKLGKRPMPERVISDEDLFLGHDKGTFLQDENDYHSKGW